MVMTRGYQPQQPRTTTTSSLANFLDLFIYLLEFAPFLSPHIVSWRLAQLASLSLTPNKTSRSRFTFHVPCVRGEAELSERVQGFISPALHAL